MKSPFSHLAVAGLSLVLVAFAVACGADGTGDGDAPAGDELFVVDDGLAPRAQTMPDYDGSGSRPVAALTDSSGITVDFIEDEWIVSSTDRDEIDGLLDRWNGTIVESVAFSDLGADRGPTVYLIRVDAANADPAVLEGYVRAHDAEYGERQRVSSLRGLKTLAAAAEEANERQIVLSANWIVYPSGYSDRSTSEAPPGAPDAPGEYVQNSFEWPQMQRGGVWDIGVAEAWRMLEVTGRTSNRVRFVVLDGGFQKTSDFPEDTRMIPSDGWGIPNTFACTDDSECRWHGTDVFVSGAGLPDNDFGSAGPGGPVAAPVLVQSPANDFFGYVRYLRDVSRALGGGEGILNMSGAARIPRAACLTGICKVLDVVTRWVRRAGILSVAAAGNNGKNVDHKKCFLKCWEDAVWIPCELDRIVCVGGLGWKQRVAHERSNWATGDGTHSIDIWAPYDQWVGPDPEVSTTDNVVRSVPGTSFSAPFVSGVAALIWAANPSLAPDGVVKTIRKTAHPAPGDVRGIIDAYGGVLRELGGDAPPYLEIVTPTDGRSFSKGVAVRFRADVADDGASLTTTWYSSTDGELGTGTVLEVRDLSYGDHQIRAVVADGRWEVEETVGISVVNDPPTLEILQPEDGDVFTRDQTIQLIGTSVDPNEPPDYRLADGAVRWWVDDDSPATKAPVARGHIASLPLQLYEPGAHTIIFRGTDTRTTVEATVDIRIDPPPTNRKPKVTVTSPTSGTDLGYADKQTGGTWYLDVTLKGNATDPEDGSIPASRLRWSSDIDGSLGTGTTLTTRLTAPTCGQNKHQVTLSATDSEGKKGSATILLVVKLLC